MANDKMDTEGTDGPHIIKHKRSQASEDAIQNMPWVEKYRPASLEDLVAHEDIISILTRLIDNDNLPHLLLYGPPGTGKVSARSSSYLDEFEWYSAKYTYVQCFAKTLT